MSRYGIGEWYGESFVGMSVSRRQELATIALGERNVPACPFKDGNPPCSKRGGVCSLQRYQESPTDRVGEPEGAPVITCPSRFEQENLLLKWLADIVGFDVVSTYIAREVPFMKGRTTSKAAGMLDMVLVSDGHDHFQWYGLEIQAVYFSGEGMNSEYLRLRNDVELLPLFPDKVRRPDWRSSSAKRLMPQLQIKGPTLRRWGTKIAVAVDRPFFNAIGGPSSNPSHDLNEGEVLWLVPELVADGQLQRGHWEVLTLESSGEKLLAAETVKRDEFEQALRRKLRPLVG